MAGSLSKEDHSLQVKQFVHQCEKDFLNGEQISDCRTEIHPHSSCLSMTLIPFYKLFPTCFAFYSPIHFIPILLFKHKQLFSKQFFSIVWKLLKNTTKSTLFCCAFQSILLAVMCTGIRNGIPGVATISTAGFLSGASVLLEGSSRRIELALYMFTRAMYALCHYFQKDEKIISEQRLQQVYHLLFCISTGFLCMLYFHYPTSLKSSLRSILGYIIG